MRIPPAARSSLAAAVIVSTAAALLSTHGMLAPAQRFAADALLRWVVQRDALPEPHAPDVVIVAIDPQSLRAFPSWPWPRRLYAQAIERLDAAGARAIAFDIDLSAPREREDDAALAAAIEKSGRVALAAFRQLQPLPGGGELEVASVPHALLADRAAAQGSVLMPVEPDGTVRFAPRASPIAGRDLPTLASAALRIATGDPTPEHERMDPLRIDYRRSAGIAEIPIVDVIEGRFDPRLVAGRAVLVGATAAEFQDLWDTPLAPARPGVWLQAVSYRTLAAERAGAPVLRPVPAAAGIAAIFAACLLTGALAPFGPRRRLAALALCAGGGAAGAVSLLATRGVLLDLIAPLSAMLTMYALGLETVRERLRSLVAQRERSLTTLFQVGETAAAPLGGDPLGAALALLADVVDASAVALLRSTPEGRLDGRRLDWQRRSSQPAGDTALAARALAERATTSLPRRGDGSAGLCVYAPLFAGARAVGVLVVERESSEPLERVELRTLATVGAQIALLAENLRLVDDLRSTFDASIEAIASAVEARDGYTESHCRRLAIFSVSMADRIGLDADEIEAIRLGALLHDVGKIGVRDEILLKPGRFTPSERAEMQEHTVCGHRIVLPIHGLRPTTLACVRHHHERWDGTGYPDRLAGEQIPLGARIVAIVDVWDALSTDRPYKKAFAQDEVRELLEKARGTQFEPALVDLFLEILDEEGESMLALTGGRPS
jgi:HD-GYP domain-containing protein (c-di-GMP phosphodiesterase class II)/CHASE2 domain-containing sensor protein